MTFDSRVPAYEAVGEVTVEKNREGKPHAGKVLAVVQAHAHERLHRREREEWQRRGDLARGPRRDGLDGVDGGPLHALDGRLPQRFGRTQRLDEILCERPRPAGRPPPFPHMMNLMNQFICIKRVRQATIGDQVACLCQA